MDQILRWRIFALQMKTEKKSPWRKVWKKPDFLEIMKKISLTVMGRLLSLDLGYQDPVEFYVQDGLLYYVDFNGSLLSRIPQPVMKGLENLYPLFTGRGYIWVSSIPLLWDVVALGKGIGTFPFYYPQSEVAGMLNVHGSADYCIEQAHSWYLQTGRK